MPITANSRGVQLFIYEDRRFRVLPNEYIFQVGPSTPTTPEVFCVGRFGHGELELFVEDAQQFGDADVELQERLREFSAISGTHEFTSGQVVM